MADHAMPNTPIASEKAARRLLCTAGAGVGSDIGQNLTGLVAPLRVFAALMLASFALTLPGRAPVWLAACTWAPLPFLHAYRLHDANVGMLIGLVPALIGA